MAGDSLEVQFNFTIHTSQASSKVIWYHITSTPLSYQPRAMSLEQIKFRHPGVVLLPLTINH